MCVAQRQSWFGDKATTVLYVQYTQIIIACQVGLLPLKKTSNLHRLSGLSALNLADSAVWWAASVSKTSSQTLKNINSDYFVAVFREITSAWLCYVMFSSVSHRATGAAVESQSCFSSATLAGLMKKYFLYWDLGLSALSMHKVAPYFKQGHSVPPQK